MLLAPAGQAATQAPHPLQEIRSVVLVWRSPWIFSLAAP
jgi:hypothetical protein